MIIGEYKIGRYHGILKKVYEDNTIDYETRFRDKRDIYTSLDAIEYCIQKDCKVGTTPPKRIKDVIMIIGKENIIRELSK